MATPEGKTVDGFETQIGVNHFAHFLLFELLKSTLIASSTPAFNSRVIVLASAAHRIAPTLLDDINFTTTKYDPWYAYGSAKTANVWMANEVDRRYGAKGVHAFSVHPGGISTSLARHMDPAMTVGFDTMKEVKSIEQGAATTVWAAVSSELEGRGGKYLEDVNIAPAPFEGETSLANVLAPGYAKYAYNPEGEKRLWQLSLEAVGIKDE